MSDGFVIVLFLYSMGLSKPQINDMLVTIAVMLSAIMVFVVIILGRMHSAMLTLSSAAVVPLVLARGIGITGDLPYVALAFLGLGVVVFVVSLILERFLDHIAQAAQEREVVIEQMASEVRENERLVRELEHRVFNNLQIVQSMLGLQEVRLENPARSELAKARSRVTAIALMYDFLSTEGGIASVALDRYLDRIARLVADSNRPDREISGIKLRLAPVQVCPDDATLVGTVFNELIANALNEIQDTEVVSAWLKESGNVMTLTVQSPKKTAASAEEPPGLELILAQIVSAQLDGSLDVKEETDFVQYELSCPIRK